MTRETKQQIIDRLAMEISELKSAHKAELIAEKEYTEFWIEKYAMTDWAHEKALNLISEADYFNLLRYLDALRKIANRRWYNQYSHLPEFKHCARAYAADTMLNPAKLLMDALEDERAGDKDD
jgi:hypothetical protein